MIFLNCISGDFNRFVLSLNQFFMGAINTQIVDITLIALALISGAFYAKDISKKQKTSVKIIPLFVIWSAGFWCLLNWIGHSLGVLYVNIPAIINGTFMYTFYFYSLMFMGVVFMLLSFLQLNLIKKMSEQGTSPYKALKRVSALIIILSLPIIPLNPIGALPVIAAVVILTTIAITKKSWEATAPSGEKPIITPQVA